MKFFSNTNRTIFFLVILFFQGQVLAMYDPDVIKARLKILNYNVWHGLTTDGLSMKSLEPKGNKEKRIQFQIEQIKKAGSDIVFFQEVNPAKAPWFSDSLTHRYAKALNMDSISVIDNCGMKVGGYGFPGEIYSGLVILAKKKFQLKKLGAKKLSGGFGFCSSVVSIQFAEFRYALAGKITVKGQDIFLVNTHLHHGFSHNAFSEGIKTTSSKSSLRSEIYKDIERQVKKGEERRLKEVKSLFQLIKSKVPNGAPVILAGDFNDRPNSKTIKQVLANGFFLAPENNTEYTWGENNKNHEYNKKFKFPYELPEGTTEQERAYLKKVFLAVDEQPRTLDYIFLQGDWTIRHTELFGVEEKNNTVGSDHYGVSSEVELAQ